MRLARIDCHALGGVAGDMFAAAMFDAFPELYDGFTTDLSQLNIAGVRPRLERQTSNGLYAQHFSVQQSSDLQPPRTLPAVKKFLSDSCLDSAIAKTAVDIYQFLAEAEASVHGKSVNTVHFHEVSDWDSMVDILAAAGVISRLNCPAWRIGPLPLGCGTVNTAHGEIPVPAPATLHLLNGFDWLDDGVPGERVTPTGAAILAYLAPEKLQQTAQSATLMTVGVGCGTRKLAGRANIFRVCVFNEIESGSMHSDVVVHLAFEVDDMTGEEIALALDILRKENGVLDASLVTLQGKKNRPSTGFRLLVAPHLQDRVIDQCFRQTTSLGVRMMAANRRLLSRELKTIDQYQVKTATRPEHVLTAKIESDELSEFGTLQSRRAIATMIERQATDG